MSEHFQNATSIQDDDTNSDRLLNVVLADPFSGQWQNPNTFSLALLELKLSVLGQVGKGQLSSLVGQDNGV